MPRALVRLAQRSRYSGAPRAELAGSKQRRPRCATGSSKTDTARRTIPRGVTNRAPVSSGETTGSSASVRWTAVSLLTPRAQPYVFGVVEASTALRPSGPRTALARRWCGGSTLSRVAPRGLSR